MHVASFGVADCRCVSISPSYTNIYRRLGCLVKLFFPKRQKIRLGRSAGLVWLLLMAGCTGNLSAGLAFGRVLVSAGPEGRWLGPVVPVETDCGSRTSGLMSIGRGVFAFDPFQSTNVLHGRIGPSGDLMGETVRPVAGSKSVTIGFHGQLQQSEGVEKIVGTLTSGRCHWSVGLFRG